MNKDARATARAAGIAKQTLVNLVSRGSVRPVVRGDGRGGGYSTHEFSPRQVWLLRRRTRLLRELERVRRELCSGEDADGPHVPVL